MKAKFFTTLKDMSLKNSVDLEMEERADCLWIRAKGYGDAVSSKGHGVPICIEVYGGRLRVILWPNINSEDPLIIDMEGAREDVREKETRIIESNSLPYFGDDGLANILDRKTRKRVFVKKENLKDITTDGGRMIGLYKFEIKEAVNHEY